MADSETMSESEYYAQEEEEQLQRAIALSLQEDDDGSHRANGVIDLCSDEEKQVVPQPSSKNQRVEREHLVIELDVDAASINHPENRASGILGQRTDMKSSPSKYSLPESNSLGRYSRDYGSEAAGSGDILQKMDRKKMEEERLARKRKASISPPPQRVRSKNPVQTENKELPRLSGMQYPKGVVKKTWAQDCPRDEDIKIEEVLQVADLEAAVLSAFVWETSWVLSKIKNSKTRLVFVMHAKEEESKERLIADFAAVIPGLELCFPPMPGNVNCMHSKLQLLFHRSYLRIVVPSANLTSFDWGEMGGIMENTVFLIDLPRLSEGQAADELTFFGKELIHFLEAKGLPERVMKKVGEYNFSGTKDIAFVHSIGGSHVGKEWRRTGYCGLGTAIQQLGLQTRDRLELDYVTSSLGSLDEKLLATLYLAAQGDNGLAEYNMRNQQTMKKGRQKRSETETEDDEHAVLFRDLPQRMQTSFRIYFPAKDTVACSKGGVDAGGTICFQSKWFHAIKFPRGLMRDCKSKREGLLMHNKMLFVRPAKSVQSQGGASLGAGQASTSKRAWVYHGSANLTESAWGRLVKDRSSKGPKLNCRNWECGVVIPIPHGDASDRLAKPEDIEVFDGHVPVPMQFPAHEYGTKTPWFFMERGI